MLISPVLGAWILVLVSGQANQIRAIEGFNKDGCEMALLTAQDNFKKINGFNVVFCIERK